MKNKLNIPILTENNDDTYNFNYIDHYKLNSVKKFYRRCITHNRFGILLIRVIK